MTETGAVVSRLRKARVVKVEREFSDLLMLAVELDGSPDRAVAYTALTGSVSVGDEVIVNTVACALRLGSGGQHFVLHNCTRPEVSAPAEGHIIKLRYTPLQCNVLALEEPASPHHTAVAAYHSLEGMPVVVATLHSMIAPIAAGILVERPGARIVYVMTDSAALALPLSHLVRELKETGFVHATISSGQAFGGDYEAVNPLSALLAAGCALAADAAIVAPGVGHVGTATPYGFSGVEQASLLDMVLALGGRPVAAVRMSEADPRPRHRGLSHHTLTILGRLARERHTVALPVEIPDTMRALVDEQLRRGAIAARHEVVRTEGSPGLNSMLSRGLSPRSMGRTVDQDRLYFLAAAAAGACAGQLLAQNQPQT